jgi:hypothetical protein
LISACKEQQEVVGGQQEESKKKKKKKKWGEGLQRAEIVDCVSVVSKN